MGKAQRAGSGIDLKFRAFSDRTRLRILSLLQQGECCVGDLVTLLRLEQPSVSRHLAYLRKAGLVVVRKAKLWSYYSLAPARGAFHQKLLECLGCCFQEAPQIQKDLARAAKLRANGGCCPQGDGGSESKAASEDEKTGGCCPS